jgi:hypothetical protein
MKCSKELTIDQLLKSHIRMVFGLLKFHKTFLKLSTHTSTEGQSHFDKVLLSPGPIVSPVAHKFLSSCNHDPFIILTLNYNKGEGSFCCGLYTGLCPLNTPWLPDFIVPSSRSKGRLHFYLQIAKVWKVQLRHYHTRPSEWERKIMWHN